MSANMTCSCSMVKNETFKLQVAILLTKIAAEVLREDPDITGHPRRVSWAMRVLERLELESRKAAFLVCSHPAVDPDGDIETLENTIRGFVNVLAGVYKVPIPAPLPQVITVPAPLKHTPVSDLTSKQKRTMVERVLGRKKEKK